MYPAGTTLRIPFFGFYHYGVVDDEGGVIHNSKKWGVVKQDSIEDFAEGKRIDVCADLHGGDGIMAVEVAKRYLNAPYNLFTLNCEHFVRLVHGLDNESVQVQKYMMFAIGVGVATTASNPVAKVAGGAAALASILTDSEKSPYKNAAVAAMLAAGLMILANK